MKPENQNSYSSKNFITVRERTRTLKTLAGIRNYIESGRFYFEFYRKFTYLSNLSLDPQLSIEQKYTSRRI